MSANQTNNNASLMELGFEIDSVIELVQRQEGEITSEQEQKLDELFQQVSVKVDNIGFAVVMREKQIEGLKNLSDIINQKKKKAEEDLKGFKAWLAKAVREYGSVKGSKTTYASQVLEGKVVKIKDLTKHVFTYEESKVPDAYKYVEIKLQVPLIEFMRILSKKGTAVEKFLREHSAGLTYKVDDALIKADLEQGVQIEGVGKEMKFNVQFLGLNNLKNNNELTEHYQKEIK